MILSTFRSMQMFEPGIPFSLSPNLIVLGTALAPSVESFRSFPLRLTDNRPVWDDAYSKGSNYLVSFMDKECKRAVYPTFMLSFLYIRPDNIKVLVFPNFDSIYALQTWGFSTDRLYYIPGENMGKLSVPFLMDISFTPKLPVFPFSKGNGIYSFDDIQLSIVDSFVNVSYLEQQKSINLSDLKPGDDLLNFKN